MPSKGSPQEFVSGLPWRIKVDWFGKSGVYVMDKDRRTTIKLDTHGTHDCYQGVTVDVTSKTHGLIKKKWFGFDEYLKERSDNRPDYKGGFSVLGFCGWEWYIAVPRQPELFTRAVEDWINMWT